MTGNLARRLHLVEAHYPPPTCPTCTGWAQIEIVRMEPCDPAPPAPPTVCPTCGKRFTGIRRIVVAADEMAG